MKLSKILLILAILLLVNVFTLYAGFTIPGEIVIQLHDNVIDYNLAEFVSNYDLYEFEEIRVLSQRKNIRLFSFNSETINEDIFLATIKTDNNVYLAYLNYSPILIQVDETPSFRSSAGLFSISDYYPNDPSFNMQWAHENTGQIYPV